MTTEAEILAAFRRHKPDRKKLPNVARTIAGAKERCDRYMRMGAFKPGDRILDVGCAWGAILLGLPESCEYVGIDVNRPSIEIAKDVFRGRGEFIHLDRPAPKYNPHGRVRRGIALPEFTPFDSVLACSLFTHFTEPRDVKEYINDTSRVLRTGGRFLSTWFAAPPNKPGGDHRRYVWPSDFIIDALEDHFDIIHESGGATIARDDQWHIVTQKAT